MTDIPKTCPGCGVNIHLELTPSCVYCALRLGEEVATELRRQLAQANERLGKLVVEIREAQYGVEEEAIKVDGIISRDLVEAVEKNR